MKIVVEIDDAALKAAIEQQVSREVAAIAGEAIKAKIDEILEKRVGRADIPGIVHALIKEEVSQKFEAIVTEAIGKPGYTRNEYIKGSINTAARQLVKDAAQRM